MEDRICRKCDKANEGVMVEGGGEMERINNSHEDLFFSVRIFGVSKYSFLCRINPTCGA